MRAPVTIVTIDRPEARNAVDGPTAAALADAFRDFDADEDAAVAVLTGAGGTFCAGADLKAVGTERGNRVSADGDGPMGPSRMQLTKPVIAAIEGHAVAGGLELALWADLRVAAADAVLGVFCRRWGVPLIDGGTVRLPRLIGQSRAMDLVLTGRPVAADEAHAMGLVNRLCAAGHGAGGGRGAWRGAGGAAADLHAAGPAQRPGAVGARRGRGDGVELAHGLVSLESDALVGAGRFAAGAGRHGARRTARRHGPRTGSTAPTRHKAPHQSDEEP